MAKKMVYTLIAVCGIGAASAGAWWIQRSPMAKSADAESAGGPGGHRPSEAAGASSGGGQGPAAGGGQRGGTPAVEVTKVGTQSLRDDAQSVGTVRSRQSVMLRPEVSGRIAHIGFKDGAVVKRGQVLVRLDDTLQKAELSQAEAQLSIAQANLRRNQELVAQNFVAQRVLDESQASLQVAQAQVALAKARLERMVMRAPFDGVAGLKLVDVGAYVKDGADLVNIEDMSALQVDYRLPERYQTKVMPGQSVEMTLDGLPSEKLKARIVAVDPLLDANGRSLLVRAALPGKADGSVRPGMFARLTTVFDVFENAMVVPEEAIVPQGGKQFVFRIEKEGEGETAKSLSKRVEVQVGARRGAMVQISGDIQPGDTVVLAGQQRLQKDGTAVRVVDMNRPAGRGGSGGAAGNGSDPDKKAADAALAGPRTESAATGAATSRSPN